MPEYLYRCPICKAEKSIDHSMSEVDEPSEELQRETSCNESTCKIVTQGNTDETEGFVTLGTVWKRVPQVPNFLTFGSGDKMKGGTLSKEEKSKRLRERSNKDSNTGRRLEEKKRSNEEFKQQAAQIIKENS